MTHSHIAKPQIVTRLTKRNRLRAHDGYNTTLDRGDDAKIRSSEAEAALLRRQCKEGTALYQQALIEAGHARLAAVSLD
jgi:hypothetical protein